VIPYGHQSVSQQDIDTVIEVLRSDFLTQGPAVARFEAAVAAYCGVAHAVAVSSATAALHVACLSLGLSRDGLLWTSPNTFVASANCGRYCGADVDFVDIDPDTLNMSADALESRLRDARAAGRVPDVVVPVHFAGLSCDMKRIGALAEEYGFQVLEDASHAIGGSYAARPVGCCEFSSAAVFSFHPVKVITTGEGGMVVTNDGVLAERVRLLRTHGITRSAGSMRHESEGPWYYEQVELGYNYRMTDIQAALGASQMTRLSEFVRRRTVLAERYSVLLADLPVRLPPTSRDCSSALHLYVVQLETGEGSPTRRQVVEALHAAGIGAQVHYIPVHLHPYYRALGFGPGDFPQAEGYYERCLSLPLYPDLTLRQQDRVVAALAAALEQ
jgi:UDP-4-amino-4,6-dideoxy-N-acetyl-beta-L-altrosamine transaminase